LTQNGEGACGQGDDGTGDGVAANQRCAGNAVVAAPLCDAAANFGGGGGADLAGDEHEEELAAAGDHHLEDTQQTLDLDNVHEPRSLQPHFIIANGNVGVSELDESVIANGGKVLVTLL